MRERLRSVPHLPTVFGVVLLTEKADIIGDRIEAFFDVSGQTYGYRRIHAGLVVDGILIDDDTVREIMPERGLTSCQPGPKRLVTTIAADAGDPPDLVRREFTAEAPGHTLCGDITYITAWEGWMFLATVLDGFSKKVVGYAMSSRMTSDLVVSALDNAAEKLTFIPGVTIFHSDRGSRYMSSNFTTCATRHGIRRSVGRTGACYDNAWAESFNGTLKNECVNRKQYATRASDQRHHALHRTSIQQQRRHSELAYSTPNQVESEWLSRNIAS